MRPSNGRRLYARTYDCPAMECRYRLAIAGPPNVGIREGRECGAGAVVYFIPKVLLLISSLLSLQSTGGTYRGRGSGRRDCERLLERPMQGICESACVRFEDVSVEASRVQSWALSLPQLSLGVT